MTHTKLMQPELRTVVLEDASHQAEAQPWISMECYQVETGSFQGCLTALDLGKGIRVVDEVQSASINKVGATGGKLCTFSIARFDDPAKGRFGHFSGDAVAALFFLPGDTEYDVRMPAGVRTTYLSLDQDALMTRLRILAPHRWGQPPDELVPLRGVRPEAFGEVAEATMTLYGRPGAESALDHVRFRTALVDSMAQSLLHGCCDAGDWPGHQARRMAVQRVRSARAFISDAIDMGLVPSMVDICAAVGVTERVLQYAFRDVLDMSPVTYLRVLRLNRVRTMLRDPAQSHRTVAEVAMHWGFYHLGRFAGEYRRLFRETPSNTRADASR